MVMARCNRADTLHGGLIVAALLAFWLGVPSLDWPWYLLLPLLAYAGVVVAIPPLRRTTPRIALGRLGGLPLAFAIALSVATSGALVAFDSLARPDVTELASHLPLAAFGHWLVG